MAAKWKKLTDAQWDALDRLRFSTTDVRTFRNATIVLMSDVGRTKASIAIELGCSPATVENVRRRFRERGLNGLQPVKPTGRPSRATAAYRAALREAVSVPPQTLGFGFSVWSANRLASYLARQTGVTLKEDRLRQVLREEGFSFQRPKHTMKGKRDEVAYEKARRQLKRLKKGRLRKLAPATMS
jgi:transposase